MKTWTNTLILGSAVVACGATYPVPAQRMADAESAERSARELGAESQPDARLHLRLAREQIAIARASVLRGDNHKAEGQLIRARADAELALALAREQAAKIDLQEAVDAEKGVPQ